MIRRRAVDARPKGVAGACARRTYIGMAVVTVDAPGMQNSLMIKKLMTGTSDVVHDLVAPLFLKSFAHSPGDIVDNFVPADALPLAFTSLTDALERITNALGIGHLIQSGRSLGAVAPATAGMLGVAFEAPDAVGIFFDKADQAAGRLTVETNSRDDLAVLFDLARPLCRVVLDPIVPFFHGRITREPGSRLQTLRIGIERFSAIAHLSVPS